MFRVFVENIKKFINELSFLIVNSLEFDLLDC